MNGTNVRDEKIVKLIHELIETCGGSPESFAADITTQMIQNSLKLMVEEHDIGQLKLMNRALKEMRYAYRTFNQYREGRCISIFGSARTPESHPDYHSAKELSTQLSDEGWMCITGAAEGIMKAGLEGTQREGRFGLSILLPFESTVNSLIEGDPKLMMFRYFFTRKLMFISHADAIAAFPGGVGTLDELFEVLTLMQTGKSNIVPLVLLQGTKGNYWEKWEEYIDTQLLGNGWISPEDKNFYYMAKTPEHAKNHILKFYRNYHSSRYVNEMLVMRLNKPLNERQLAQLNEEYSVLVQSGSMVMSGPLVEEKEHLDLPRLVFHHTRKKFGLERALINQINDF